MPLPTVVVTVSILLYLAAAGSGAGPSSAVGKVYLMQQRAPARAGRQAAFARDLAEWASTRGVARLLVLSGLDATLRKDRQLVGPATR